MSNIFFTSDTHFGHKKCWESFRREKFSSLEDMNETIIARWNARVKKGDRVYHLGDFALGSVEEAEKIAWRLNGQIFLIRGNHEKVAEHKRVAPRFVWIKEAIRLDVGQPHPASLLHYPMVTWCNSGYGAWSLHGHCHGNLPVEKHTLRADVGFDCFGEPVSVDEIAALMAEKIYKPVDHHGR